MVLFLLFIAIGLVPTISYGIDNREKGDDLRSSYASDKYGIKLTIPHGMDLYTIEKPGKLRSLFTDGDLVHLLNPNYIYESVSITQSGNTQVTENDLKQHMNNLTHQRISPILGYKRISLNLIKIGHNHDKIAIEHIYNIKGDVDGRIRQIMFSHRNRGFIVTCGTSIDRYENANRTHFNYLFNNFEFN